ncbi:hypothetical protein Tco_1264170 [Tanacetum coccineum]
MKKAQTMKPLLEPQARTAFLIKIPLKTNVKTWDEIVQNVEKRPPGNSTDEGNGKAKVGKSVRSIKPCLVLFHCTICKIFDSIHPFATNRDFVSGQSSKSPVSLIGVFTGFVVGVDDVDEDVFKGNVGILVGLGVGQASVV